MSVVQVGFWSSRPTRWRGFWPFFGIAFVANVLFYTAMLVWAVVSADVLRHDPNRTMAQAWHQIAVSPLLAISVTLFGSLLAIVIAAMAAKYVCETTGRFPLSLVAVLLVICTVATLLQMTLLGLHTWTGNPNRSQEILRIVIAQFPMVLGLWLWGREPVRA